MIDEKLLADFTEAHKRLSELVHALDPLLHSLRYAGVDQALLTKLEEEVQKSRRHYADFLVRYPQEK